MYINNSTTPNILYQYNGTVWVKQNLNLSDLDPTASTLLNTINQQISDMSSDAKLTPNERIFVNEELIGLIGWTGFTTTLPTMATIDTTPYRGSIYNARKAALNAGLTTANTTYIAVETAYTNLKTYLEGSTFASKPWDISGGTLTIGAGGAADATTWRNNWATLDQAIVDLNLATAAQLKTNADNAQSAANRMSTRGIGLRDGYNVFSGGTAAAGQSYFYGFDSNGNAADINPYVVVNGINVTLAKGVLYPNTTYTRGYLMYDSTAPASWWLITTVSGVWKKFNNGVTGHNTNLTFNKSTQYVVGIVTQNSDGTNRLATLWNDYKSTDEIVAYENSILTKTYVDANKSNLLSDPASQWTLGTGAMGIFVHNGNAAESTRELGDTPFKSRDIIWKAASDSTVSDQAGGWDATVDIDATKSYRFSVWAKQMSTNGTVYLGCSKTNTNNLDGSANGNPYFWSGDLPSLNKWYLIIGYVNGSGDSSTTDNTEAGIYELDYGRKLTGYTFKTFKNKPSITQQTHRTYHYYNTTIGDPVYFYSPRLDVVNGYEPTISELLGRSSQLDWAANWDATKTVINGKQVLTAQLFAGTSDGTVAGTTGIALGSNIFGLGNSETGVAGYANGNKNFHIKSDGSAVFGRTPGNQLIVNTDGSVTTPKINIGTENLIPNSGFNFSGNTLSYWSQNNWDGSTALTELAVWDETNAWIPNGWKAVMMHSVSTGATINDGIVSDPIPVTQGQQYNFTCYSAGQRGLYQIEVNAYDANDAYVTRLAMNTLDSATYQGGKDISQWVQTYLPFTIPSTVRTVRIFAYMVYSNSDAYVYFSRPMLTLGTDRANYAEGYTVIDGGRLANESIDTRHLKSDSITADKISTLGDYTKISAFDWTTDSVVSPVVAESRTVSFSAGSKIGTDFKTSSTDSFPDTTAYNQSGYSGTLLKDGPSTVVSGSLTPGDSRTQTDVREGTSNVTSGYPASIAYATGGYTGTLLPNGNPVFSRTVGNGSRTETSSVACTVTRSWTYQAAAGSPPVSAVKTGTRSATVSTTWTYSQTGGSASTSATKTASSSYTVSQSWVYQQTGGSAPSSRTQTDSRACTISQSWAYDGDAWVTNGGQTNNAASSVSYNSGGYSGTLGLTGVSGGSPPAPTGTASFGATRTTTASGTASYSGTVSTSDTRTYGWVTSGSQTSTLSSTYNYNDGTYSGTLSLTSSSAGTPPAPTGSGSVGSTTSTSASGTANYSGTCYTADTRTYGWVATSTTHNAASSISYNDGTYSGTLNLDNVTGTPPTPSGTSTVGTQQTTSVTGTANYSGTCWTADTQTPAQWVGGAITDNAAATQSYNSGGYSGTLNKTGVTGTPPTPTGTGTNGQTTTTNIAGTANYSGTVTNPGTTYYNQNYSGTVSLPAVDTRVYGQSYAGTVYLASVNRYGIGPASWNKYVEPGQTYYVAEGFIPLHSKPIIDNPFLKNEYIAISFLLTTLGNDSGTKKAIVEYYNADGSVSLGIETFDFTHNSTAGVLNGLQIFFCQFLASPTNTSLSKSAPKISIKISVKHKLASQTEDPELKQTTVLIDDKTKSYIYSIPKSGTSITTERLSLIDTVSQKTASLESKFEGLSVIGSTIYLKTDDEVKVMDSYGNFKPLRASSVVQTSSASIKSNLKKIEEDEDLDPMAIFKDTQIFTYHLNSNLESSIYDKKKVGILLEMASPILRDDNGIDQYSMLSLLFNVVQKQQQTIESLQKRLDEIETIL
jgi:hypothetical protein